MRYLEWKEINSCASPPLSYVQNKALVRSFLETFEKEIPSHVLIQFDQRFHDIFEKQIYDLFFKATFKGIYYLGNSTIKEHHKIRSLLASNPYQIGFYVDFVKKIRANKYLSEILIYRKSKNRLFVEFDNVELNNRFEFLLGYKNFTQNHPVKGNEYPQRELNAPQILKFYVHESKNGELTIPFPCKEIRDNFYNLLNIQKFGNGFITKGQNTSLYFNEKIIKKNVKISIPVPDQLKSNTSIILKIRLEELVKALGSPLLFIQVLICLVGEYANSVEGEEEKPLSSVKGSSNLISSHGLLATLTQNKTMEKFRKIIHQNTQALIR